MRKWIGPLILLVSIASAQQDSPEPTFRSGTRLVEVDVVVRDKNGPVTGLTKDDFTVFDCKPRPLSGDQLANFAVNTSRCKGKTQAIQIFHGPSAGGASLTPQPALPQSPISNRVDDRGAAIANTTVLLLDQLNVSFDYKEYERTHVIKYLKSLRGDERIAVYSLGKDLHILEDFTDDPRKLVNAVSKLDSGLGVLQEGQGDPSTTPLAITTTDAQADAYFSAILAERRAEITNEAIRMIVQHLSGIPGRKNLVWIKEIPTVPGAALLRLRAANIALYPVLVRTLKDSGILQMTSTRQKRVEPVEFILRHAVEDLGASLGGAGFGDATDIAAAVSRAEQDSGSAYLLGFYPSERDLDGTLHTLNVVLSPKFAKAGMELVFRRQYLATSQPGINDNQTPAEIFENPLSATAIGLSAVVTQDQAVPGVYQLDIAIDLRDVRLTKQEDRWVGSLLMEMRRDVPDASGVLAPSESVVHVQSLSLTDEQLREKLTTGFVVRQRWTGVGGAAGALRVVVQDQTTEAAGSLRVPLGKAPR